MQAPAPPARPHTCQALAEPVEHEKASTSDAPAVSKSRCTAKKRPPPAVAH